MSFKARLRSPVRVRVTLRIHVRIRVGVWIRVSHGLCKLPWFRGSVRFRLVSW